MNDVCLPWQDAKWQQVKQAVIQDRLPHALLLQGEAGVGKRIFAKRLTAALLCMQPKYGDACSSCRSCQLRVAGNHPDLVSLHPEKGKSVIIIDNVRDFMATTIMRPHVAARRLTLIVPAEALNQSAANALLKTLEEPTQDNHIILVSDLVSDLPATIVSRAQRLVFPVPDSRDAFAWLQDKDSRHPWGEILAVVHGAPLRALEFAVSDGLHNYYGERQRFIALLEGSESAVQVAKAWSEDQSGLLAEWLYRWLMDLARGTLVSSSAVCDQKLRNWFNQATQSIDTRELLRLINELTSLRRGIRKRNLNPEIQYNLLASHIQRLCA